MDSDAERSLLSRTSVIGGVVGGLLHAGIAVFLWDYFGFDNLWALLVIKPLTGTYIVLGMFVLGFVPVTFYLGRKCVSPAIVVAASLLLSGFLSWQAGPIRAPRGAPTPFGLYVLLWVGVIVLAGVAGGLEHTRRRRTPG